MMDFESFVRDQFSIQDKNYPPIGDTTLRNPLILRVFDVLNGSEPDITGHCAGMLREIRTVGFKVGTLSPTRFLSLSLIQIAEETPPMDLSERFSREFSAVSQVAVESLAPLCALSVDYNYNPSRHLLNYWRYTHMITQVVLRSATKDFNSPRIFLAKFPGTSLRCSFYTAELRVAQETCCVPRDYILMLSDILASRYQALLFLHICGMLYRPPPISAGALQHVLGSGDKVLLTNDQAAYKRLKMVEPFCMSLLLSHSNQNLFPSAFESFIQDEVAKFDDCTSKDFFSAIRHAGSTPRAIANLFGCFRFWGHPILNSDLGRDRVKRVAMAEKTLDPRSLQFLECSFKKWIILGYYRKHGKWPQLDLSGLPQTSEIVRARNSGLPVNLYSPDLQFEDWARIKGEKTLSLPMSLNTATLLSDKSHSLNLAPLLSALRTTGRPGNSEQRRVLLSVLRHSLPSVSEIVRSFAGETLDRESLLIGLREKEREVNEYARLFGLMTLPMRMYFVLTEQMLANDIIPLFPETTMKDNILELKKKKEKIYKKMSGSNEQYCVVVLNIDFEKWNLNMRKETTLGSFRFLDELYGTGCLFSNSHKVFEQSIMYMCHGVHPLLVSGELGGDNVWTGHKGGIEGLRQKGWTLITIAAIKEIAFQEHLKCDFLGQGDNQVVAVTINLLDRSEESMHRAKSEFDRFRSRLIELFGSLGLPIKGLETWSSSEVFAYGKDLYYRGDKLGLVLKRASRCYFLANEGFPSFSSYLSSCGSAISTLNDECSSIVPCWMLYLWNVSDMIKELFRFHPLLRKGLSRRTLGELPVCPRVSKQVPYTTTDLSSLFNLDPLTLVKILTSAKSPVHGLPTLIPLDLLSHGFPDPLTASLTWTKLVCEKSRGLSETIPVTHWQPLLDNSPSPLQLCEDPCSLPLLYPAQVSNRIRSVVCEYLRDAGNVPNRHLARFFSISTSRQEELSNCLMALEPCNPRLMADLLAATPVGQATAIISQVSSTTTINRLMYKEHGDNVTELLQRTERVLLGFISWLWRSNRKTLSSTILGCPTEQARRLRKTGWGKDLLITVPHPLHFLSEIIRPSADVSVITIRLSGAIGNGLASIRGPFPSYAGSTTVEKLPPQRFLKELSLAPLLRRPIRLCRIIGWITNKQSNLSRLIRSILAASTDLPSCYFDNEDYSVSGNPEHRYNDSRTDHMTNVAGDGVSSSHVYVGVSSWTKYCKGGKNYTIHFQSILSDLARTYFEKMISADRPERLIWLQENCQHCIVPTYEGLYELQLSTIPDIPSFPDVETLFLAKTSVSIDPSLRLFNQRGPSVSITNRVISFSVGVSAALSDLQVGVSTTLRLNGVETLKGFAVSLLARYIVRRILSVDPQKTPTFNYAKLLRSCLNYYSTQDAVLFHNIDLLVQYSPSRDHILQCYGVAAVSPEIPLTSHSRQSSVRDLILFSLYKILTDTPSPPPGKCLVFEMPSLVYDARTLEVLITAYLPTVLEAICKLPHGIANIQTFHRVCQRLTSQSMPIETLTNGFAKIINGVDYVEIQLGNASYSWLLKTGDPPHPEIQLSLVHTKPPLGRTTKELDIRWITHKTDVKTIYKPNSSTPPEACDHDYTNLLYMGFSLPTSSWYKWTGLLTDLDIDCSHPAALADGAGGVARTLYDMSASDPPQRAVFFNTRPYGPDTDQYSLDDVSPVMLSNLPNVYGLELLKRGIGDLTNSAEVELIAEELVTYRPTVITCDAETAGWYGDQTQSLTSSLVRLMNALPQAVFVVKGYMQPKRGILWVLNQFAKTCRDVSVLRSQLSPRSSSEIFIYVGVKITRVLGVRTVDFLDDLDTYRMPETQLAVICGSLDKWRSEIYAPSGFSPYLKTVLTYELSPPLTKESIIASLINYYESRIVSLKWFRSLNKRTAGRPLHLSSRVLNSLRLVHLLKDLPKRREHVNAYFSTSTTTIFLAHVGRSVRTSIRQRLQDAFVIHLKRDRVADECKRHCCQFLGMFQMFFFET
ncbi:RNA-dependent RNA polymerase [Beihai barnacle virus 7]|uniref:Replicase n=1 Tax=Beihai barnacle virus 7 TaxID=1922365 RepID=A0A1L3KMR8_9RHAB|nr:RNA-dependent RNA polymerase [Beihai barnacle virus 7]APG78663.1 RNA-dependent RNA polymerase [Beihai barnacle virus 7]